MDNLDDTFKKLLSTPVDDPVDPGDVAMLSDRCPAFLLPVVLQLRHPHPGLDDASVARLVERVALSVPDRRRVKVLIDPEGTGRYDDLYPVPQVSCTPTTVDAIDTFLSSYGDIDPAEEALLNRMIFNPVPDYAATLERETPVPGEPMDEQDRLLDAFIAGEHHNATAPDTKHGSMSAGMETETEPSRPRHVKAPAGSLLSESLAKIFIKQHNYKRAYEIISSLNLNYPEKSIYFADQLRFLSRLIANQEARERKEKEK